jgi:hypothetical protein
MLYLTLLKISCFTFTFFFHHFLLCTLLWLASFDVITFQFPLPVLCVVLFRSSYSVYLIILSLLPVSFCVALCVFAFPVCILSLAPHRLVWPWTGAATGRSSRAAGNSGRAVSLRRHCACLLRQSLETARGRSRRCRSVVVCRVVCGLVCLC